MNDEAGRDDVFRIAVLASGRGSNLQAIIDRLHGKGTVEIVGVASDTPGCEALARAESVGIATRIFPVDEYDDNRVARDGAIGDWIEDQAAKLIVLAGYMQLLHATFVERFAGRIINVHPSLLPAFPGIGAIQQALEAGATHTGVTVHFVDEGVDTGPVIAQREVPIADPADLDALTAAVHAVEHELLPAVIEQFAARD